MRGKIIFLILLFSICIRVPFILFQITGDEAVFYLMAKKIFEHKDAPLYLWKAHYAGTLSSYISAFLFGIFGHSFVLFKTVGLIYAIFLIVLGYLIGENIQKNAGIVYASLLGLGCYLGVFYTVYLGGAYIEGLSISFLAVLLLFKYLNTCFFKYRYFILGLVCGLGLWLSPYCLIFILTALTLFVIKQGLIQFMRRYLLFFLIGFVIGNIPSIIYNLQHPLASIFRFFGRVLNLDRSVLGEPDLMKVILSKTLWRIKVCPFYLIGIPSLFFDFLGARTNFYKNIVSIPFISIYGISCIYLTIQAIKNLKSFISKRTQRIDMHLIFFITILYYVVFYTLFIGEYRVRFMFPLYLLMMGVLTIGVCALYKRYPKVSISILIFMLSFNFIDNMQNIKNYKQPYCQLIYFLNQKNIKCGYSDYDTAYIIVALSDERIILSPTLFTSKYERYPLYTLLVNRSLHPCYIFRYPKYKEELIQFKHYLKTQNISYKEKKVGQFVVVYSLSKKISVITYHKYLTNS